MYILPFDNLSDQEFYDCLISNQNSPLVDSCIDLDRLNSQIFNQFNFINSNNFANLPSDPDLEYYGDVSDLLNNTNYYFSDEYKTISNKLDSKTFSITCHNINSISKHIDEFVDSILINKLDFDILSFTETKLTDNISNLFNISGYNMFVNNFQRNSGGLAVYVKNNIDNIKIRNDLNKSLDHIETLFLEFKRGTSTVLVGTIYRRPSGNMTNFIEELDSILSTISNENKVTYIMGDFNINLLMYKKLSNVTRFVDLLHGYDFLSIVNKPTRVTCNSATLIDQIWTNNYTNLIETGIFYQSISDHLPIFSIFKTVNSIDHQTSDIEYRNFSSNNILSFKNDLENTVWDLVTNSDNPEVSYNNFELIFLSLFNKNFPLIKKQIKNNKNSKPYITQEIKAQMRERDRLQKKFAKKPITFGPEFRSLRNRVNKLVNQSKHAYFKNKLNENIGNTKKTWQVMNEILHRPAQQVKTTVFDINNEIVSDGDCIAHSFNQQYATVGQMLSESINNVNNVNFRDYLGDPVDVELDLYQTSEHEILNIVNNLGDVSPGSDGIPGHVIKKVIDAILIPIVHICNKSFITGIFPSKFKIARITPIYKKGDKDELSNYRPISILPVLSKVLERLVCTRLTEHLENNEIITDSQHGFRRNRSTTSAVLTLTDHILQSFDNKQYTLGIFLDFTKAFETVNHEILLQKLQHIGVRGVAFNWFKNYLDQREQFVMFNGHKSSIVKLSYSIPQDSILGPQLFSIYINDVIHSVTDFFDINSLIDEANLELTNINNWLIANKLTDKSHCIIFKRNKTLPPNLNEIKINNVTLNIKKDAEFLGITLNYNLT